MSKEKKFHQLIEEFDQEKKELSWKKIQERDTSRIAPMEQDSFDKVKRRGVAAWKKALATGLVSIIVVGAGVFGGIKFFSKDEPPSIRYCDASMYDAIDVQITLKDRVEKDETILFLDWYEITDYYADRVYELKDSRAEIGYYEQIVDVNTGSLVEINVIRQGYQLSGLDKYDKATEIFLVGDMQVEWARTDWFEYATFSFGNYNYYISLEYPMEEGSILDIVAEMLLNV